MEMVSLVRQYSGAFISKYGVTALAGHRKALNAILRCCTAGSGERDRR